MVDVFENIQMKWRLIYRELIEIKSLFGKREKILPLIPLHFF